MPPQESKKKRAAKPKKPGKFKKAPQAPKRFKSAFIFFSSAKHPEIRKQLGEKGGTEKTTNVAKLVSEAWKGLSPEDREEWEEKARQDKARYEVEKTMYQGPWKIPATKRTPKDPDAPKRPMSAFLAYSNGKRAALKRKDPSLSNADVSRILSRSWKDAPTDQRQTYIDDEFQLRQKYKIAITKWREESEKKKEAERAHREEIAMNALALQQQQQQIQQQLAETAANQQKDAAGSAEANQALFAGAGQMAQFNQHAGQVGNLQNAALQQYQGYPFNQYEQVGMPSMENRAANVMNPQYANGMSFLQGAGGFSSGGLPSVYDATLLAAMQNQQQQNRGMGLGGAGGYDSLQNSIMQAQLVEQMNQSVKTEESYGEQYQQQLPNNGGDRKSVV